MSSISTLTHAIRRLLRLAVPPAAMLTLAVAASATAAGCPNEALRAGSSAALPDCRAYEQVSPENKGGVSATPAFPLPAQLSTTGEKIAYLGYNAFPGAEGNSALYSAHVGTRTASGWQNAEWTPAVPKGEALKVYKVEYAFSPDLSQVVVDVPFAPLAPGAAPGVLNVFLRDQQGSYSLVSGTPEVPIAAICEPEELPTCWSGVDASGFAGASSDFSQIVFQSNARPLPESGFESLYEREGGELRRVGILPDGTPAAISTAGAGSPAARQVAPSPRVERAVSDDGSHVVFQAPADGGLPDEAQNGQIEVYDRIDHAETIEISRPAPGAVPAVTAPESATFAGASVDGSRVFFTSSAELTTQSNTGEANNGEDLYEYDLQSERLTDLTVDTNPADVTTGAMVQGVIDSSTDGSYIYFVADGQLDEGQGVDGQPNLYMIHNGGKPLFIATLDGSGGNCVFLADTCDWSPFSYFREAYVTPDGTHLAFMSRRSLPTENFPSGYENADASTGESDAEVYEYTAPTGALEGHLVCASCDSTGARPTGNAMIGGLSPDGGGHGGKLTYASASTSFYRVRAMSDDGRRLFYLAPSSQLASVDGVYEYEQPGLGGCPAAGSACQELISSSTSTQTTKFLGAGPDGGDVFIATLSRLVPGDVDSLFDVYDARVDGGFPSPPVEPSCEVGCQQSAGEPAIRTPVNLATGVSGNLAAPAPVVVKPQSPTPAQLLSKALRACRRDHNHRKRAACEAQARKRYHAKTSRRSHKTDRRVK